MIEIQNLTKRYGNKKALDDVSFTVKKGEILGFLGPNGAGKSTTMNILTGYISTNEGVVKINGKDILENPKEAKRHIGYLPEQPPLYVDMKVIEYLNFVYELKKVPLKRQQHLKQVMDMVGIYDVRGRLIKNLSKGYRQRVGLAQALIGNPEVLVLDEPTVGLDPKQIIEIRNVINKLGKEHTIILSSHIMQEVSAVCERVVIINGGKIVAIDTPDNLSKAMGGGGKFTVRIEGPRNQIVPTLRSLNGVIYADALTEREDGAFDYIIETEKGVDVRRPLFFEMSAKKFPILMLHSDNMNLEQIFLNLTKDEAKSKKQPKKVADNADEKAAASHDMHLDESLSTDHEQGGHAGADQLDKNQGGGEQC